MRQNPHVRICGGPGSATTLVYPTEIRLRVEAVNRWHVHDWNTLDNKIRSSIVEGVSVFLSMFDLPAVARVSCPPAPQARPARTAGDEGSNPALAATALSGDLPPLDALVHNSIEG